MDLVSHTLLAYVAGRSFAPGGRASHAAPEPGTVAMLTATTMLWAVLPDVDHVVEVFSPEAYLRWHRGPTHCLLFGVLAKDVREEFLRAAEGTGDTLALLTWVIFGSAIVGQAVGHFNWLILLYALLSLTVIRMLPVFLSLAGSGVDTEGKLFIGWFGPRGLASIVFAVIVIYYTYEQTYLAYDNFAIVGGTDDVMEWWFYTATPLAWGLIIIRVIQNLIQDIARFRNNEPFVLQASLLD